MRLASAERMVVWLLRWTGLRVSEACSLKLDDVDLTPGRENLLVRQSKTAAGMRTIPVVPCLVPELETWLERLRSKRITSPQANLLATGTGSGFKPTFVWRLVKRAGERADVRPVLCQCGSRLRTRHAAGCSANDERRERLVDHTPHASADIRSCLLNKGLRLEVVSRLLGHSSTVVTERAYAELLGAARSETSCFPRSATLTEPARPRLFVSHRPRRHAHPCAEQGASMNGQWIERMKQVLRRG